MRERQLPTLLEQGDWWFEDLGAVRMRRKEFPFWKFLVLDLQILLRVHTRS